MKIRVLFFSLFLALGWVCSSYGSDWGEPSKKIKSSQGMDKNMIDFVIATARTASQNHNVPGDRADYIKTKLTAEYSGTWHCFVSSFEDYVKPKDPKYFINFFIGQTRYILYQNN